MSRPSRAKTMGLTSVQLAFLQAYDGDTASTAKRLGIPLATASAWSKTDWFIERLEERNKRESALAAIERHETIRGHVLDRTELQVFWSRVTTDEGEDMKHRLTASKHLADSLGMNIQKIEHSGGEKPVQVQHVDLVERIKLLAVAGKPIPDFLE